MKPTLYAAVAAVLVLGCSQATTKASEAPREGALPEGWTPATDGGQPGQWKFVRGEDGPVLALDVNGGDEQFNLLLSGAKHGPDLALSVRLRADRGEIDRGGGLVWRAADASNYYVTRWNPLENNLRLYKVEDGTRTKFASVDTKLDPAAWHTLGVTMKGAHIEVLLDGTVRLSHDDTTFSASGAVGLWTKADASTSFSLPEVRSL